MTDAISRETFDHLVQLAALELSPEEADYLLGQLNNQLRAIHELEAIPLAADTPPASHGIPYTPQITPPARRDIRLPFVRPEDILAQAPETEDGYVVVPEIPHTELG